MNNELNPLVSIIIPVYNREDLIGETLDSVLAQTYQNWECIVVDDGSIDNTKSVVQKYVDKDPRFMLYDRPVYHKPGGSGARNYGFEVSKGDFIVFLDSDDLFHEQYLEFQLKILENSPMTNYIVCDNRIFIGNTNNIIGKWFNASINSDNKLEDYITKKLGIQTASVMFRKHFLERISKKSLLFNEDLLQSQEWELFCRILFYDSDYSINNKILLFIRKNNKSITTSLFENNSSLLRSQLMALKEICYFLIKERQLSDKLKNFFINSAVTLLKKNNYNGYEAKKFILSILKRNFKDFKYYCNFCLGYFIWKLFRRGHSLLVYK